MEELRAPEVGRVFEAGVVEARGVAEVDVGKVGALFKDAAIEVSGTVEMSSIEEGAFFKARALEQGRCGDLGVRCGGRAKSGVFKEAS